MNSRRGERPFALTGVPVTGKSYLHSATPDFVLDTPQPEDAVLQKAIQTTIAQHQTWLIFGAALDDQAAEVGIHQTQIASPARSLQANIDADPEYVIRTYASPYGTRGLSPLFAWRPLAGISSRSPDFAFCLRQSW